MNTRNIQRYDTDTDHGIRTLIKTSILIHTNNRELRFHEAHTDQKPANQYKY